MANQEGIFKRCGCRDTATGKSIGARCGRLADDGHGSWFYSLELPRMWRGGRRRWRRGGFASPEAAAAERKRIAAYMADGRLGEAVTVGEWLDFWLESLAQLRPTTLRNYAAHVRLYLKPHVGSLPLAELDVRQINTALAAVARAGRPGGGVLADATILRIWSTLRTALNAAVAESVIASNPARGVAMPKASRPHAVVWTHARIKVWRRTGVRPAVAVWTTEHTAQFLNGVAAHRLYGAFHLIALRGLRRGEACGLRWCDIDFARGMLTVNYQIRWEGGAFALCPPKTATSRRVVYLDQGTLDVLKAHRRRQQAELREHGVIDMGFVFCDEAGRPLRPDYLTRTFQLLIQVADLPPIRLHDLRHGAATLALAAGADLKVVADQLGHSSVVLTADTYISVARELGLKAAEAVARLILEAGCLIPGTGRKRQRQSCAIAAIV